ncbi:dermonecrotic toxin domain-containing protein [Pseudomonas sp. Eth.TT006]
MNHAPDNTPFDLTRPDSHYQPLLDAIPLWLRQSAPEQRAALSQATPKLPTALQHTRSAQRAALDTRLAQHASSHNRVVRALADLKNPADFAEPLLQALLETRFGLTVDVRQTCLHLHIPTHLPWLRAKTGAARTWTVSLLEAALHNFESGETEAAAFDSTSTYITPPSANGQFSELPQILEKMPISGFTRLCRELDIGQQYKAYLENYLNVNKPQAAAPLQGKIRHREKTALSAALHMAQLQKRLASDVHSLILGLLDNTPHRQLKGQLWYSHSLSIMDVPLSGVLLFAPDAAQAQEVVSVVAYIPDDPEHPIKQYPSSAAFDRDLSQRLSDTGYQRFFSRFINHEDQGRFFAQLNQELNPVTWHPLTPNDPQPAWRAEPNPNARLRLKATALKLAPLTHLYRSKLDKILNDARVIAVSTAEVDRRARWALWDAMTDIASTLLTIAAFIVLPFVPVLGELMLGYMAYQLLDVAFEGVIDWAEGHGKRAIGHFVGAVESAVQMGTFAIGGAIAANEFRALLPEEIVRFIDRLSLVKRPDGTSRYWSADLKPYERGNPLPDALEPDAQGLHQHQGKRWLTIEGKHYAVVTDPASGEYRIEHPTRPEAYQPQLRHNGEGLWKTELDQPLTWDQPTLLQRSGVEVQRLSERERLLRVSDCSENALRKAHVNGTRLPPLFADTLKRFNIDHDIETFITQTASDQAQVYLQADPLMQLELLQNSQHWPANRGLRLHDGQGQTLWQHPAADTLTLQIDVTRLQHGDLLKTLLLALPENEVKTMMGDSFGAPAQSLEVRAQRLRQFLSARAQTRRQSLFEQRYRRLEQGTSALARYIMDAHRDIPRSVAEALVETTHGAQRRKLSRGVLSPRLTELTREAALQVRMARAREGLELQSTRHNPDTELLALHTLEHLAGWPRGLRLEVRHYDFEGALIDSIGPADAAERKVLVLTIEGNHQAFDGAGAELSGGEDFYDCLLRAMPDRARAALKLQTGEGEKFKRLISVHRLSRNDLRALLARHPDYKPTFDPEVMRLLGGTDGYRQMPRNMPTLKDRTENLLPHLSPERLDAFVQRLQQHPDGPRAELTRLIAEYAQLQQTLGPWSADIPHVFPGTRINLAPEQMVAQRSTRREFAVSLLDAWRLQQDIAEEQVLVVSLSINHPIIGELPVLTCDFPGATHLTLEGHATTRGVHEFLQHFKGVQRLNMRGFNLRYLPDAIAHFPRLEELVLSDCGITLTAQSRATLAQFIHLKSLDLYKNPLGLAPDVASMPNLEYIDLAHTGIEHFPDGLLTRTRLNTVLLNDNAIVQLPEALFALPPSIQEGIDLGKNPIDLGTHERIKRHYAETGLDFSIYAPENDILQVQSLYPLMDKEEASRFIYLLPGDLEQGTAELSRLQGELLSLHNDLNRWTADIPALHPSSGLPFTERQLSIEQASRDEFRELLLRCWRRETESEEPGDLMSAGYELGLDTVVTGDLPALNADFSHVSLMYLSSSHGHTGNVTRFLQSFAKLRALTLREFRLTELPPSLFQMSELRALNLSECEITLTPDAVLELAQMTKLEHLSLSNNPLTLTPDVSQMAGLKTLRLDNTEITELPVGLGQLTQLELADFSDNAITEVPSDLLEWPREFSENIDLQGNPFSEASLKILIEYFRLTSVDFDIEAVIERAEMEVSSSGDSTHED